MTRPGGSAAASSAIAVMNAGGSPADPLCGRKYTGTPAGTLACRVLTCRAIVRSADQPFSTRAEPGYDPVNRTAVRSRCSREASATANPRTAASSRRPRTSPAAGARASSDRPSRSSFSSAAGTPSSSATAAEDAHPAMSYSGAGEHSRFAASTAVISPCPASARPRRGITSSTIRRTPRARR